MGAREVTQQLRTLPVLPEGLPAACLTNTVRLGHGGWHFNPSTEEAEAGYPSSQKARTLSHCLWSRLGRCMLGVGREASCSFQPCSVEYSRWLSGWRACCPSDCHLQTPGSDFAPASVCLVPNLPAGRPCCRSPWQPWDFPSVGLPWHPSSQWCLVTVGGPDFPSETTLGRRHRKEQAPACTRPPPCAQRGCLQPALSAPGW